VSLNSPSAQFYVCQVRDTEGSTRFEAIYWRNLNDRKKELIEDYKGAYSAYREAKKEGMEAVKPRKPAIRTIGGKIKGKSKAEAIASRFQEKWDAKYNKGKKAETEQVAKEG